MRQTEISQRDKSSNFVLSYNKLNSLNSKKAKSKDNLNDSDNNDENSQIKGVLYKGRKRNLEFEPENGMKVIIKGSIEVYEKNGYYQLKANTIKKDGIGDLYIAFEKLKKKLFKMKLKDYGK